MLREYRAIRMQGGQETTGRPLALIRLTNAGSCPSRQRDCVAEPIRLANAAAPLLLRSQARRKAYRARSAETKGTAQLPCGSGETQGEGVSLHFCLKNLAGLTTSRVCCVFLPHCCWIETLSTAYCGKHP